MQIEELKKEIEKKKVILGELQTSQTATQKRLADLQEERGGHIVNARAHRDAEAQAKIRVIDANLVHAKSDAADDAHAIGVLSSEIAALEAQLASTQRDQQRAGLEKMLRDRAEGKIEARIADAVEKLKSAFDELKAADQRIVAAASAFERELGNETRQQLDGARRRVADTAAYRLRDHLPVMPCGAMASYYAETDVCTVAAKCLTSAIGKVESSAA